jgi:alpha-2-macroglobulin family protein
VTLDKGSYIAGDTIVASIAGANASKQPLAGQTVSIGLYASQHPWTPVEINSFPGPTSWGEQIAAFVKVRLDASGHATLRVTPKVGLKSTDQDVTVVAVIGSGRTQAYSARSATFYQADEEIYMLPARSSFQQGDTVFAPFVIESRSGARVTGRQAAYELVRTDYEGNSATTTVVASGTTSTDTRGIGYVRATYTGSPASLLLRIKGQDQSGRVFQDARDITVGDAEAGSPVLDMTMYTIATNVGDTPTLTVTSPAAMKALLSFERGRVHHYGWVQLTKGDNTFGIGISPDLAPGFHIVFSYFLNGVYGSEELPVYINNSNRLLQVTATPDHETYTRGQIAHVDIAVRDSSGAPVAATFLAHAYEARMSANLVEDQPSIAGAFLITNRLGTNGSSSLVLIGTWGDGICGGGVPTNEPFASGMYPGRSNVWDTDVATDTSGHASIDVPMSLAGSVKLVLAASTASSSWGQVETILVLN